jgi:hypothetical protein
MDTPADLAVCGREVRVHFHRRAHLPIILASGLLDSPIAVPCWEGFSLRMTAWGAENYPAVRRILFRGNPG